MVATSPTNRADLMDRCPVRTRLVYARCMARTNVDIDEAACARVMRRFGLRSKREAVNFALRELATEIDLDHAHRLRGSGWEGDLETMRDARLRGG